jgi:hypothetical protein
LLGELKLQDGQAAGQLSAHEVAKIVGVGASDRGGRGNANAGDGGVAFVLAGSSALPGGPELVRAPAACLPWPLPLPGHVLP